MYFVQNQNQVYSISQLFTLTFYIYAVSFWNGFWYRMYVSWIQYGYDVEGIDTVWSSREYTAMVSLQAGHVWCTSLSGGQQKGIRQPPEWHPRINSTNMLNATALPLLCSVTVSTCCPQDGHCTTSGSLLRLERGTTAKSGLISEMAPYIGVVGCSAGLLSFAKGAGGADGGGKRSWSAYGGGGSNGIACGS